MYGNLVHDNKVDTVHYFMYDIDVSDKSVYIETSFLANYQYNVGDTAYINNVAFTLVATPVVDAMFAMGDIVTCCIDMKNKKLTCINTHKANFDYFYVYNKFADADSAGVYLNYETTLFSQELMVPKNSDGDDIITDVKVGLSAYLDGQFSYEPEYNCGHSYDKPLYDEGRGDDTKFLKFIVNIDGTTLNYPISVSHRSESFVVEKTFKLKSGTHTVSAAIYYSGGLGSLTANSITGYVMGSNITQPASCDVFYVAFGDTPDKLGAHLIAIRDAKSKVLSVPDYIPGTNIPVISLWLSTNTSSYDSYTINSVNIPKLRNWDDNYGRSNADDPLISMRTQINNLNVGYTFCSVSYMPSLEKIELGKYTQVLLYDVNFHQSNKMPVVDYSRCKNMKMLGYAYSGASGSYYCANTGILDNFRDENGDMTASIRLNSDSALLEGFKILLNHYPSYYGGTTYYASTISFMDWVNVELLGNTERLFVIPDNISTGTSSYSYYAYHPIKNFKCTAKNYIRGGGSNLQYPSRGYYGTQSYVSELLPVDKNVYDYFNPLKISTTTSSVANGDGMFLPDLHRYYDSSNISYNSAYIHIPIGSASADERVDINYEFDGNFILPLGLGKGNPYFIFCSIGAANTSYALDAPIYINHTLSIHIKGAFYTEVEPRNEASYIATDRSFSYEVATTSLTPSTKCNRWYTSGSTDSYYLYTGDYWYRDSAVDQLMRVYVPSRSINCFDYVKTNNTSTPKNIPVHIEIDGNFSMVGYWSPTFPSSSCGAVKLGNRFFLDWKNHPENRILMHVGKNYIGVPYVLSAQTGSGGEINGTAKRHNVSYITDSGSITITSYSTLFSDPTYGSISTDKNIYGDPLHPYEIHVDKNAILMGYGHTGVGSNIAFFCDKITFTAIQYADPSDATSYYDRLSGGCRTLAKVLANLDYFKTTNNGYINFNGFADGAVLNTYGIYGTILPRNTVLDFSNIGCLGEEAITCGTILNDQFVWPTEENPIEIMSTAFLDSGVYNWGLIDLLISKMNNWDGSTVVTISRKELIQNLVWPSMKFNARIVGHLPNDTYYSCWLRKSNLTTYVNRLELDVDREIDTIFDEITKIITWDDPLLCEVDDNGNIGDYCLYNPSETATGPISRTYTPFRGSGFFGIYDSGSIFSYYDVEFTEESFNAEFRAKGYNTDSGKYRSTNTVAFIQRVIAPAIEAGDITIDDINIPVHTIGSCIKHLGDAAFLGVPVYYPDNTVDFPYKEIDLSEAITIGQYAFNFAVYDEPTLTHYDLATHYVERVICGNDLRWIGCNPWVNEFVIPSTNPFFVVENGYIYNRSKTILFRAVNVETIKSYTEEDGPISIPSTVRLIVDGSALKYDKRITHMEFTSVTSLLTRMTQVPPNLVSLKIPSNTTFMLQELPENCTFEIINVGGSSSYYQPTGGGLANEIYSPIKKGELCSTFAKMAGSVTSYCYETYYPYPAPPLTAGQYSAVYDSAFSYGYSSKSSTFRTINFVPSENYPDPDTAEAYEHKNMVTKYQRYHEKISRTDTTSYTNNYNIVYMNPSSSPVRLNLDPKCYILTFARRIDILGIPSSISHPIFMDADIGSFDIVTESTVNYSVSDDGKSLYYNGNLMKVITDEIDEYHITTHVWPGAFYGCHINKLYIDIASPNISVSNPLGSINGYNYGTTAIPKKFELLFGGAAIDKLYIPFESMTFITTPGYSTNSTPTAKIIPSDLGDHSGYINEIHITGLTQAIVESLEPTTTYITETDGIPWAVLTGLSPAAGAKETDHDSTFKYPIIYFDDADSLHLTSASMNMGCGVAFNNASALFADTRFFATGSGSLSPIRRNSWIGTDSVPIELRNDAAVIVDGDGEDLTFSFVSIATHSIAIKGHPTSITLNRLGTGTYDTACGMDCMNYRNRAPWYWEKADTITTDKAYSQMRINSIEKFNKVTFDLTNTNNVLWIERGAFSMGLERGTKENGSYVTDKGATYIPSGYTDWERRERLYGDNVTNEMKQMTIDLRRKHSSETNPDDKQCVFSLIHNTAEDTLNWLRTTNMYSYYGGVLNLTLPYGNNDATLTITPFTNIERNIFRENLFSWDNDSAPGYIPRLSMCLSPQKNTDYVTFNNSTRDMTINVPAGTTPEEFRDIWCDSVYLTPFTYDEVTIDTPFMSDLRIFQRNKIWDCKSANHYTWTDETYLAELRHGEKHIWFKKIIINQHVQYYDSFKGETPTNRIMYSSLYSCPVAEMCPAYLWGYTDRLTQYSSASDITPFVKLTDNVLFPWTEMVYKSEIAVLSFPWKLNEIFLQVSGSYSIAKMTTEMWDDITHIQRYLKNSEDNYLSMLSGSIHCNNLSFENTCRKVIVNELNSLIVRTLVLANMDAIYIEDNVCRYAPIETLVIHNITPYWSHVADFQHSYEEPNYDNTPKRSSSWFLDNRSIKNVELMWNETDISNYAAAYAAQHSGNEEIIFETFQRSSALEHVKMNINMKYTCSMFDGAKVPNVLEVKNADCMKKLGSNFCSNTTGSLLDDTVIMDFDGNVLDLVEILEEPGYYSFEGNVLSANSITFPNIRIVDCSFDKCTGVKELILPSCTSFKMLAAGSIEQIKIPEGCTIESCPDSVLIIFI